MGYCFIYAGFCCITHIITYIWGYYCPLQLCVAVMILFFLVIFPFMVKEGKESEMPPPWKLLELFR